MTTSIKATRPKKPNGWQTQTIKVNKVKLRVSTRRGSTDWEDFHLTMNEMILNTRDPLYRAWLAHLYSKVDKDTVV